MKNLLLIGAIAISLSACNDGQTRTVYVDRPVEQPVVVQQPGYTDYATDPGYVPEPAPVVVVAPSYRPRTRVVVVPSRRPNVVVVGSSSRPVSRYNRVPVVVAGSSNPYTVRRPGTIVVPGNRSVSRIATPTVSSRGIDSRPVYRSKLSDRTYTPVSKSYNKYSPTRPSRR